MVGRSRISDDATTFHRAGYSGQMRDLFTRTVRPRIVEVAIALERLPETLAGFTIAQITDVHIGPTVGPDFVRDVVAQVNGLGADLIAITGDLVDGRAGTYAKSTEPLAELRARHGIFYVTGNHEYYWWRRRQRARRRP